MAHPIGKEFRPNNYSKVKFYMTPFKRGTITPRQFEIYKQAKSGMLYPKCERWFDKDNGGKEYRWRVFSRAEAGTTGRDRAVTRHVLALVKAGWLVCNLNGRVKPVCKLMYLTEG